MPKVSEWLYAIKEIMCLSINIHKQAGDDRKAATVLLTMTQHKFERTLCVCQ